ncbi:hypothetical protein SAMN02799636_01107 [Methylobacterium sp. 275MFSha3.1]|uniref:hypothetical protein n=1 Tax=Methylobacterium sp. 275MFSha3.1 TaxID=1502746 RepID=UPI0008A7EAAD|nr:hypothetical protein [Methylobacterium sp. 275MFSha3.1]SEH31626.1 hypothetical protein SAMN02799636_01107 [Methylobacterium sp. 275MFSha3.1]
MSAVALDPHAEMSGLLREIAGPAGLVKARIRAAARALGWSYSRTKDLWYADPRTRVDPPELLQARATVSAFASTPVEMDLERLRSLESEVAELRAFMAATLRRMEGASADPAQHHGAGSGPSPGGRAEGASLRDRAVAEGA